jgi:hypothetical protein
MVILFLLSAIIIAIGKAIADITSDETNWSKSIFSKYKINSFFGCKDNTWERKYYFKNKTLKYLFSTIFVFTTDIWHLGNFISKVGTYTSIGIILFITYNFYLAVFLLASHIALNNITFHWFYHRFLRK